MGAVPPLPSPSDDGVLLFAPYNDGMAVPVTLTSWRRRRFGMRGDQAWAGLVDGDKGYAIIAETPFDMMTRLESVKQEGRRTLAPQINAVASKGEFRYVRRLRYCGYRWTARADRHRRPAKCISRSSRK